MVSDRQLCRWIAKVKNNEDVISSEKLSGALASLDREEKDVASGWVLDQLENNKAVHLDSYRDFVLKNFGIEISVSTCFNYLSEDGFSSKLLQKKSASFTVDVEKLRSDLWS